MLGAQTQDASKPQQNSQSNGTPSDQSSYLIDGEAGPCSLELTVLDESGKPVFAALIHVHFAYGFAGFHKLDLSVYTNNDGKTKFIGLPARLHSPPAIFQARKGELTGEATYSPSAECDAKHDIVVRKQKP